MDFWDSMSDLGYERDSTNVPYQIVTGRAEYDAEHIPGAGFLDLQGELSDNTVKLRFMLPRAAAGPLR
jgi:3-mercaptopyruvate sulfurtransferase SseA